MIKIRLARKGRKKCPFFDVVVADSRSPRDGKFIEKLGWYNPKTKEKSIDNDAILKWVGNGAQLTEGTQRIFKHVDVLSHLCEDKTKHSHQGLKRKEKEEALKNEVKAKKEAAIAKNTPKEEPSAEQTEVSAEA